MIKHHENKLLVLYARSIRESIDSEGKPVTSNFVLLNAISSKQFIEHALLESVATDGNHTNKDHEGNYLFETLDELGEFAKDLASKAHIYEIFLLSANDFTLGIENTSFEVEWEAFFEKYGTRVEAHDEKPSGLFFWRS